MCPHVQTCVNGNIIIFMTHQLPIYKSEQNNNDLITHSTFYYKFKLCFLNFFPIEEFLINYN